MQLMKKKSHKYSTDSNICNIDSNMCNSKNKLLDIMRASNIVKTEISVTNMYI